MDFPTGIAIGRNEAIAPNKFPSVLVGRTRSATMSWMEPIGASRWRYRSSTRTKCPDGANLLLKMRGVFTRMEIPSPPIHAHSADLRRLARRPRSDPVEHGPLHYRGNGHRTAFDRRDHGLAEIQGCQSRGKANAGCSVFGRIEFAVPPQRTRQTAADMPFQNVIEQYDSHQCRTLRKLTRFAALL